MKKLWILIVVLFLITSCSNGTKPPVKTPGSELPTPVVKTTSVPDAATAAGDFFTKWEQNDYAGMYALLSPTSRDAISQEDFVSKYAERGTKPLTKNVNRWNPLHAHRTRLLPRSVTRRILTQHYSASSNARCK